MDSMHDVETGWRAKATARPGGWGRGAAPGKHNEMWHFFLTLLPLFTISVSYIVLLDSLPPDACMLDLGRGAHEQSSSGIDSCNSPFVIITSIILRERGNPGTTDFGKWGVGVSVVVSRSSGRLSEDVNG